MIKYYTLEEKRLKAADLWTWIEWMGIQWTSQRSDCIVKQEKIGDSFVSTVFLGMDFSDPPRLWETRVFGGPMDTFSDRCAGGWEQAEAMHEEMAEKVRQQQRKEQQNDTGRR